MRTRNGKALLALAMVLALGSCGSGEKDSICACIESGNTLNKKANEILEKGATDARRKELETLKADKAKKCAEFQTMGGEEMKQRMADCGGE